MSTSTRRQREAQGRELPRIATARGYASTDSTNQRRPQFTNHGTHEAFAPTHHLDHRKPYETDDAWSRTMSMRLVRMDHVSGQDAARVVTRKRVRAKTARRREQCRVNQARYRDKQAAHGRALRAAVQALRGQVDMLHAQHQKLQARLESQSAATETIAMLFHLLRHGLTAKQVEQQLAFVNSTFVEAVQVGTVHGRNFFVDQLDRFSTWWGDFHTVLDSVGPRGVDDMAPTLHATGRIKATVTQLTIQHIFPHLLLVSNRRVFQKLLGQRLVCDVLGVFVFNERRKIVRVDWTIDFVAAMAHLLSISDIGTVLKHARIERDAFLLAPISSDLQDTAHKRHTPHYMYRT